MLITLVGLTVSLLILNLPFADGERLGQSLLVASHAARPSHPRDDPCEVGAGPQLGEAAPRGEVGRVGVLRLLGGEIRGCFNVLSLRKVLSA